MWVDEVESSLKEMSLIPQEDFFLFRRLGDEIKSAIEVMRPDPFVLFGEFDFGGESFLTLEEGLTEAEFCGS